MKKIVYAISILCLLVIIVLNTTVFKAVRVSGDSMLGSLHNKDLLVLNKLSDVNRFDIVVFQDTTIDSHKLLIKRVMGVEGDTVRYKSGVLYINDIPTKDSFANLDYPLEKFGQATNDFEFSSISSSSKIPKDSFLVLGDNRHNSIDSRDFGLIHSSDVVGVIKYNVTTHDNYK